MADLILDTNALTSINGAARRGHVVIEHVSMDGETTLTVLGPGALPAPLHLTSPEVARYLRAKADLLRETAPDPRPTDRGTTAP